MECPTRHEDEDDDPTRMHIFMSTAGTVDCEANIISSAHPAWKLRQVCMSAFNTCCMTMNYIACATTVCYISVLWLAAVCLTHTNEVGGVVQAGVQRRLGMHSMEGRWAVEVACCSRTQLVIALRAGYFLFGMHYACAVRHEHACEQMFFTD